MPQVYRNQSSPQHNAHLPHYYHITYLDGPFSCISAGYFRVKEARDRRSDRISPQLTVVPPVAAKNLGASSSLCLARPWARLWLEQGTWHASSRQHETATASFAPAQHQSEATATVFELVEAEQAVVVSQ